MLKYVFMAYLWVDLVVVFGKDQRCEKKKKLYVSGYREILPRISLHPCPCVGP